MTPIRASSLLLSILAACIALPACARDCAPAVEDGWVRLPPVAMPMLAGFGRITNPCGAPVTIVGASSPSFGDVSVHETRIVDGVSRMRAVPGLEVQAGGEATLAPGGLHLMLMQPRGELAPGESVQVEFQLEDGGVLRGEFEVRGPGA
jgi:copper(I)-binding protein